ncbi:translation elongation factor G [Cyphellophora europaea CBS 101466]|uniref:Ribosome-releasing factor 2, mitochondrial n=1 Tax=Cyphellophora europaea (strain CBS 101466) TaxID=1220924 RepID=W2RX09_CYPE1|nr:translation elongation factor G [Cyphellophora europaea CBS 101466]ETN40234.1 translation elongation factor G [Cyphellophora europaea CBS 101466]
MRSSVCYGEAWRHTLPDYADPDSFRKIISEAPYFHRWSFAIYFPSHLSPAQEEGSFGGMITRCGVQYLLHRIGDLPVWQKAKYPSLSPSLLSKRCSFSTFGARHNVGSRIRNIGIIAHIDAGKTTTTERMLFYSGHTRRIGDVDEGSTVTDFLPAERARGITIQSAAITFDWPPPQDLASGHPLDSSRPVHHINLIDTPGHADFTFEVRRSIRVLDGAVCILDGVAGVEAQTEQVWNQAGEWKIPRIIYVNKLDRDGAAFGRAVHEIGSRLAVWPAVCQIPWFEGGRGSFVGIADVLKLQAMKYDLGSDGKHFKRLSLRDLDAEEPHLAKELRRARAALVELLSEHDDALVEAFFDANEDHLAVSSEDILRSLRRCLLRENSPVAPVFAGASFRNIGVQPLLDAVYDLLPAPEERPDPDISVGSTSGSLSQLLTGSLSTSVIGQSATKGKKNAVLGPAVGKQLQGCALAFKVVNDPRRGVLVYIRVYSGSIKRNDLLYNTNLQVAERATSLLRMYANDAQLVESIEAGQIGVIAGSKTARTGDTLISYQGNKQAPPEPLNQLQLRPIHVPPPVFFAAIEPNSLREEKDMHDKLQLLLREDPSLSVHQDQDTGQTLLSGMGELHLEIARDRLVGDLKANARMGPITIGYRETVNNASSAVQKIFDNERAGTKGKAGCTAMVLPLDEVDQWSDRPSNVVEHEQDGNVIAVDTPSLDKRGRPLSSDTVSLPGHLTLREVQTAYINGALAALCRGPAYSYPMRNVQVILTLDPSNHIFGTETTTAALSAAARIATIAAFRDSVGKSKSSLLEPVMNVDISVDDASLGKVVQDISSSRGGHIVSLGDDEAEKGDHDDDKVSAIDVKRIYAPKDPFETQTSGAANDLQTVNIQRTVIAKVPLKEMVGYLKHLRSMTGGRGTFVMSVDRFEKVTGVREKMLLQELRGES